MVIDPNRDLTLTLNSDLSVLANSPRQQQTSPYRRAFNVNR
ncbi:MAG: hypothetical protein AB4060_13965 [Crocosphaera sp.]